MKFSTNFGLFRKISGFPTSRTIHKLPPFPTKVKDKALEKCRKAGESMKKITESLSLNPKNAVDPYTKQMLFEHNDWVKNLMVHVGTLGRGNGELTKIFEDVYLKTDDLGAVVLAKNVDPCNKGASGKGDPCKKEGSEKDPCKKGGSGKGDPCKKEDPCKKKEDPSKKKEDPCKKKEDPCKKKKEDPCKKKEEDPCKKKKEDPCKKKKEDPCKKKEDPCKKKKEDPCKKKKEDPCKKKEEDPCKKKKEDPCKKKKEDPCKKKKDDPCKKKKEDPCKKKEEDPCKKKKEDPCKKKEDKKEDPCKKKKDDSSKKKCSSESEPKTCSGAKLENQGPDIFYQIKLLDPDKMYSSVKVSDPYQNKEYHSYTNTAFYDINTFLSDKRQPQQSNKPKEEPKKKE